MPALRRFDRSGRGGVVPEVQFDEVDDAILAKDELLELAATYLEADRQEKEAAEQKKLLRGPIMELISEVVRDEIPLSRKTLRVDRAEMDEVFEGDARKWASLKYPEWRVTGVTADESEYVIDLEEDPDLVKYEFEVEGYKFGRTRQQSAPVIDVEGLRADEDFVALGAENVVVEVVTYDIDEKAAERLLLARPESAPVFSRHTQPGRVSAKLLPFTKTTEEV